MKQHFVVQATLILLLTTWNIPVVAQQTPKRFQTRGMEVGRGNTFSDHTTYEMLMVMADLSYAFRKHPVKKDFVAWYCNPQFNFVRATNTQKNAIDVETGVNLGIRNYVKVSEHFYLYQMLGSGPHYFSARLDRQARGFIFSDNFALGSFIHLHKYYFLNLQFGIRHISNAGIHMPNKGVNSYIIMLGVSNLR